MSDDLNTRADQRLEAALAETGARDPRQAYRTLLRQLKQRDEATYARAVTHWRTTVIEPLGRGEGDPLRLWLSFGVGLVETLHPGRAVKIDEGGIAHPLDEPPGWDALVLHLPEDPGERAVPVVLPPEPTPAQTATLHLLVEGRLSLDNA